MAFFRLLLIGILIYLILKFIGRLLFPWFYAGYQDDNYQNNRGKENKKEGDVTVQDTGSEKSKLIKKDEGEYVDFEEIK